MAKIARRSVASNPSSPTSSAASPISNHSVHNSVIDKTQSKLSSNLTPNTSADSSDPLRPTGYQFTTHPVPNYGRHENSTASRSFRNSSSSNINNNSHSFDDVSTNTTYSKEFNNTLEAEMCAAERERVRMEFYATYDVMTGVRIAATLGGFFGLMVFLVVYKSRSHSNETLKVLKDPKIAAVAVACMQEEEEREIQQAIEATGLSIYPDEYDTMLFRRQRMLSLGNVSAPPVLHRGFRFSSVGGAYSSLLEPPRRYSYSGSRRKSASESSRILSAYPMGSSFGTDDYFVETDDELENEFDRISARADSVQQPSFLEVPPGGGQESRRSSGMTCCSTESSYLERRCSAITLGISALPSTLQAKHQSSSSRRSSTDFWDYYYPDIQVIQPTPKTSPCPSERSLYEKTRATKAKVADSSSYYNQYNKKIPKKGYYNDPESITEYQLGKRSYSISEDNTTNNDHKINIDYQHCSSQYEELGSIVKRKINDPSSNNNNHIYNSSYTNTNSSIQNHRTDGDVRRAPLASISSFKISSIDYQDSDLKSLGSDSVFVESYADTDDDMEQFSTDSDEISLSLDLEGDNKPTTKLSSVSPEKKILKKDYNSHKQQEQNLPSQQQQPHTQLQILSSQTQQKFKSKSEKMSNKPTVHQHGKRYDHHDDSVKSAGAVNHRTRPFLPRQRTISVSSNERVMLLGQQQSQEQDSLEKLCVKSEPNRVTPKLLVTGSNGGNGGGNGGGNNTHSLPTEETTATSSSLKTEIHKPKKISFSYDNNNDSCSFSSNSCSRKSKIGNSNTSISECVEVNVVIENRPTNISPSVILELPVITLSSQENDPPRDPSLPGTSRKWSKETLF